MDRFFTVKETAALRTGGLLLFVFLTRSMGHVDKKDTRYKRGTKLQNKEKPAVRELLTAGVVDLEGLEPLTSRMRTERSPN